MHFRRVVQTSGTSSAKASPCGFGAIEAAISIHARTRLIAVSPHTSRHEGTTPEAAKRNPTDARLVILGARGRTTSASSSDCPLSSSS